VTVGGGVVARFGVIDLRCEAQFASALRPDTPPQLAQGDVIDARNAPAVPQRLHLPERETGEDVRCSDDAATGEREGWKNRSNGQDGGKKIANWA
jgi:hypothetical protein